MLEAVRCEGCGGSVAAAVGSMPACIFCGETSLQPVEFEVLEQPSAHIPFAVDGPTAQEAFRAFASTGWFRPKALSDAKLTLRGVLLPAWAWSADLEVHWSGVVSAHSRSGKAPASGAGSYPIDQVLVPASATLRARELRALGAYDESALVPFDPELHPTPYELSELTRSAARAAALARMEQIVAATLAQEHSLVSQRVSSLPHDLTGKSVLVPVWIGAYTWRDTVYRVLVQGQSGKLVAKAPVDWVRVASLVLAVITGLALVAIAVALCAGLASLGASAS
jgi:hypothetical protein